MTKLRRFLKRLPIIGRHNLDLAHNQRARKNMLRMIARLEREADEADAQGLPSLATRIRMMAAMHRSRYELITM